MKRFDVTIILNFELNYLLVYKMRTSVKYILYEQLQSINYYWCTCMCNEKTRSVSL